MQCYIIHEKSNNVIFSKYPKSPKLRAKVNLQFSLIVTAKNKIA